MSGTLEQEGKREEGGMDSPEGWGYSRKRAQAALLVSRTLVTVRTEVQREGLAA